MLLAPEAASVLLFFCFSRSSRLCLLQLIKSPLRAKTCQPIPKVLHQQWHLNHASCKKDLTVAHRLAASQCIQTGSICGVSLTAHMQYQMGCCLITVLHESADQ